MYCEEKGAISSDSSLRILAGSMSGPDVLFKLSFCGSFRVPSVVTLISGMVGEGSLSGCGISSVNFDWY